MPGHVALVRETHSLRDLFKTDVPGTFALLKKWGIHEIEAGGTMGLAPEAYKNFHDDQDEWTKVVLRPN